MEELLRSHAPTSGLSLLLDTWDVKLSDGSSPASDSPPDGLHAAIAPHSHDRDSHASSEGEAAVSDARDVAVGDGSKALTLCPPDSGANPLLAVMWARFQEAARFFSQAGAFLYSDNRFYSDVFFCFRCLL